MMTSVHGYHNGFKKILSEHSLFDPRSGQGTAVGSSQLDREGLKWMGPCSVRGHLLSKFLNDDQCSVHGYHHYVFFCYNCREKRFSKCELLAFPLLDSRNTFLCKFKAEGQKFVIFSRQFSCSRELGKQVTNTFRMVQICATECLILIFLLVSQAYEGDLSKNDSGPKT